MKMSQFNYKKEELFCEEVELSKIAEKMGTPLYIYSYQTLIDNYKTLKKAFNKLSPLICYSIKANSNLTLCKILSKEGAGADIVSGGEIYKALQSGFAPKKIVFGGVGKKKDEIEYALKEDIFMFNVESEGELNLIEKTSQKLNKTAKVSLRINPDTDAETHRFIATGKREDKFGIDFSQAERLYQKIKESKRVKSLGIHMHIGSQITTVEPYLKALKKMIEFMDNLKKRGINLEYINMGGGFGISYEDGKLPLKIEELAEKVSPLIQKTGAKLIMEPGRYLTGNTGIILTQVLYKKRREEKTFVIVDAGMNDLIRPCLYGAYHRIKPLKESLESISTEVVDVVGPICESGDFFAQERKLPEIKEGDYLSIMDTGAYGYSMASSYNARPRPAEILVKDDKWWTIRERETYEDLIKGEKVKKSLISFVKMEGSGNDFIVIDNRSNIIKNRKEVASCFCQRRKGIGADGLILLENSNKVDFKMRIFNSNGSEAEMCGNGARCIAKFAYLKGIGDRSCVFETLSGIITSSLKGDKVKIKMEDPFDFRLNIKILIGDTLYYKGNYVNTGVPHFVIFTSDVEKIPLENIAPKIRHHPTFQPEGTNVDFVEVKNGALKIRTYERGVEAETLACGTGAVATAVISNLTYYLPSPVKIKAKGGVLTVYFQREKERKFTNIFLEGEAKVVYEGELKI